MATLEEVYGKKQAGIAQVLIDTYGYTMNAQGIVSNESGNQYNPETGKVDQPSTPVATPAVIEPVAAPASDTAVVESAGVAGRVPTETSEGIGNRLVEMYDYEKIDGKYYAPVGGVKAPPKQAMTPGIQKILVEKYDYTIVDGEAYAPGKAPVAAAPVAVPATATTTGTPAAAPVVASPATAATGTPEAAAAANAVAVAGTGTPAATATGTPAATATGTPVAAAPVAQSGPIIPGANPNIDALFKAGDASLSGVTIVNGAYVVTNEDGTVTPLMYAGSPETETTPTTTAPTTPAVVTPQYTSQMDDSGVTTFNYKDQKFLTGPQFMALVRADEASTTTTGPATAPVLPVATVGEGINVATPAAEAANATSGFITPPSIDYVKGDTIPELKLKSAITPGLPYGTRVTPAGTTVNQDQLLGTTKVDGVQPSGILEDGDVSVTTKTADTTKATLPDKVTMGFEDASGKSLVEDATTKTTATDISTQLAKLSPASIPTTTALIDPRFDATAQQQATSAVSGLSAEQGTATDVVAPDARVLKDAEKVSGVANAQAAADFAETITAQTATPSDKATVAGQLEILMQDFEGGNTPAWASGAMRTATAAMAARGLGASSMAAQAIIQATMESALPIAQADASVVASFEAQNLSNRQQRAMLAAEQRASFIGLEFDQAFQSRVINASKVSDIANMNFTADQQIALENSRAANTINLSNLSNKQAIVMAEAAALSNLDMANLNNRQQTQVMNAQTFLQLEMANLTNKQQSELFKAQSNVQAIFTDKAAENAASQFNATSQNQTDQFFANMSSVVSQFNAAQANAQDQANAGEENAMERFAEEMNNQRDQYNAQNRLVIDQQNAQWRRQVATADTVAVNRANEINATALLGISNTAYNDLWAYYQDSMEYAWNSTENERERLKDITVQRMEINSEAATAQANLDYTTAASWGSLVATAFTSPLGGGTTLFSEAVKAVTGIKLG